MNDLPSPGPGLEIVSNNGRATLPEKVTDVLIDRGETEVVRTVTGNHGARFSESGMDRLLLKASEDVDLREMLVERPDLSPQIVEQLLPMVSESLAMKLAERGYDVHGAIPPDMVASLRQRFTSALRTRKENIFQISVVIDEIRKGNARLDDSARQIAGSGRLLDVATLLSTFARLEKDHVFRLLYKGQTQTILILCRSLELSWPTLDAILAVRSVKNGESYFSDPKVRAEYEATDMATAQRAIRFLRVRQVAQAQAGQGQPGQLQAGAA